MCLTLAVGARPEPAVRLWTGRLSHPGLQFSPLRNGRNEGPTSWSCRVSGAPRRRALERTEVSVAGRRELQLPRARGAPVGRLRHAPPPADGRGPRQSRLAKGSSRGLPNSAARGAPLPRSVPLQKPGRWLRPGQRTRCSQLRARALPPSRPAFPTGGRGEGRGFCAQLRPQGIPRGRSPTKNSLPPGRLPGLLPPPVLYGP